MVYVPGTLATEKLAGHISDYKRTQYKGVLGYFRSSLLSYILHEREALCARVGSRRDRSSSTPSVCTNGYQPNTTINVNFTIESPIVPCYYISSIAPAVHSRQW